MTVQRGNGLYALPKNSHEGVYACVHHISAAAAAAAAVIPVTRSGIRFV